MEKAEQEWHILNLIADMEIMRSILGALTVSMLPDNAVDLLIEELDIPLIIEGAPVNFTNAAAERMAEKIAIFRARKRGG